tara:strand:+ start:149 stop:844 length:696 start_codon:yes stop_codon:yes gene_type:complete
MESFISNENKAILWSTLQENNIFSNIKETDYGKVKNIFENVIQENSKQFNGSLINLNKKTVQELVNKINAFKEKSKISVIYKAEDLQNQKREEINTKLKQQQDNMNAMLNPVIPSEVNFKDADLDKPIGDNLDRIMSEMMASRELELQSLPQDKSKAEKWINKEKKNVSFNDENNQEFKIDGNPDIIQDDNFNIFNKLKPKKDTVVISIQEIYNELIEIKNEIKFIKEKLS